MQRIPIILIVFILFETFTIKVFSQPIDIEPPLKIPLLLSGNFGELRGTHFHAGIDIKTQGVTGKPVYAVMEGYISRFKVQAGGYGHALYITHPNGYTSVYAHLEAYYPELEAYLKQVQYHKKSFEVDIYPEKGQFEVKRGEKIGVSGNTGRSGGPHLHFELRNGSQVPQNVLKYKLPIIDTIAPKFKKLVVYNGVDSNTYDYSTKMVYTAMGAKDSYKIKEVVKVSSQIGIGAEVYDYLNGSQNKCGVYQLVLKVDNVERYAFTIDEISFSETRYIRSHLDYEEKKMNKRNVHRLYREPNNKLSIYNKLVQEGLIRITDTLLHTAELIATDVYGNTSKLIFSFKNEKSTNVKERNVGEEVYVSYQEGIDYKNDVFRFVVPSYGIFSDSWFSYSALPSDSGSFSDIHSIGDEYIPFNKYPTITMKVTKSLKGISPEKLLIASISPNGKLKSEGGGAGTYGVSAKVSGFGRYVVVADTVPPTIKAYSFRNRSWYAPGDRISFKISDDLSGIKTYNGYIDGEWALFEYDAKSGSLFYLIDPVRLQRKKELHKLKIFVLDDRNNMQKFEGEFYF